MVLSNGAEFIAAESVSRLVNEELESDRRYHPNLGGITRGGLANHYPMTMLALHGLGASDQEVQAFMRSWPRHRASLDGGLGLVDTGNVTADNWPTYLGQSEYLLEFRRVFAVALAGPEGLGTVTRALRAMRDGLPMGLFHPMIRLSFALTHGDRGLIADALAYMAIRYLDLYRAELPRSEGRGEDRSAASVWRGIEPTGEASSILLSLGGASIRICERLCADRALHDAALPPDFVLSRATLPERMREIASLALRLYVAFPSLTTLHAVTAVQALAEMTALVGAGNEDVLVELWGRYWIWLTALYIEKGKPAELPFLDGGQAPSETWSDLAARARAIPEVHLIKMAYSCRWLDQSFGPDPLYKVAVLNMLRERKAQPRQNAGIAAAAL
jgi:hypothetical protein